MRAISYSSYGGVERLTPGEHPRPTPGPAQILVKVAASSVNPVDWKVASGKFKLIIPVKFPCIPGFDMAGEIVELGPGVTGFRIGQRVHARLARQPSPAGVPGRSVDPLDERPGGGEDCGPYLASRTSA
jgi:NADPH:quinone reductase-like Zn-dependent oxidoreductase